MKYVCIHGHFYQPPRENPWLEAIELQDSAYPYHDWNERITAECYAPNAASRILDAQDRIVRSSTTTRESASTSGRRCFPGWRTQAPARACRYSRSRPRRASDFSRTRLRAGAGLQPHDPAAGESPRQGDAGDVGHPRFRAAASDARPRACGCLRPRSIPKRSKSSPRTESSSRFLRRTRRTECGARDGTQLARRDGRRHRSRRAPTPASFPRQERSACSSTTARSRAASPSKDCWATASVSPTG